MPTFFLFAMMLFLMFTRAYLPIGVKTQGKPAKSLYLSFKEKALMQRLNVYAIGFVLLLSSLTGLLPTLGEVAVVVIAMAILAMPVRLTLTTTGVAISNVVYRPWNEFTGFSLERRRIVLAGRDGARQLSLPLATERQKELLPVLRQHLKEVAPGGNVLAKRAVNVS